MSEIVLVLSDNESYAFPIDKYLTTSVINDMQSVIAMDEQPS